MKHIKNIDRFDRFLIISTVLTTVAIFIIFGLFLFLLRYFIDDTPILELSVSNIICNLFLIILLLTTVVGYFLFSTDLIFLIISYSFKSPWKIVVTNSEIYLHFILWRKKFKIDKINCKYIEKKEILKINNKKYFPVLKEVYIFLKENNIKIKLE